MKNEVTVNLLLDNFSSSILDIKYILLIFVSINMEINLTFLNFKQLVHLVSTILHNNCK